MCIEQIVGSLFLTVSIVGLSILNLNWRMVAYLIVRYM